MLVVARSPSFLQASRQEEGVAAMVYKAAKATQRPWFVMTYLVPEEPPTCHFETACAQDLDVLLTHLKQRPNAQIADLLLMTPPRLNEQWTREHISWIDRGQHEGAPVNVYYRTVKGEACFDHPEVDPEDVRSRKKVLLVNWSRHFNN